MFADVADKPDPKGRGSRRVGYDTSLLRGPFAQDSPGA